MYSSVQVYSYSRCSTCKKALKWLDEHQVDYELLDIVENPPSKEIIREAISQLGSRKPLFNTSGKSYRALGSESVKGMSDPEAIEALSADGKLIKRPLLISKEGKIFVGFKPYDWEEVFS